MQYRSSKGGTALEEEHVYVEGKFFLVAVVSGEKEEEGRCTSRFFRLARLASTRSACSNNCVATSTCFQLELYRRN